MHGTTTDNEDGISSGLKDVALSELGIQQSKDLTALTEHLHFDAVFTSDLKRAVDSADLTWDSAYPRVVDERLRECNYGDLNGHPSEEVEPLFEKALTEALPNGESLIDVENRIQDFLSELKRDYDGKHVAIVAHKAPQLALEVILGDRTWQQALEEDWRKRKAWQPGWEYILD